ncbi:MAG: tetratricopeptide repeat protein [Paludibacteraceae bacterium]|nr:tetratricopeptide repeat protein [Paludibacteraceae bacterium]
MTSLRQYVITTLCTLYLVLCPFVRSTAQTTEMETRYKALEARFDGRDKLLQRDLKTYLEAYPYTTFADEVKFMQGVLQVEKGHYKQALKVFEALNPQVLTRPHQTDYSFYRGYAYLMMQEYQRASVYFSQLSKGTSRHTTRGTYYYAYCMYKLEKYDKALPAFKHLENTPQYDKTVPYYLVQLYYAQGNYEEAEARANTLLREHPESLNNGELHRILGEMAYLKQDYAKATEHLNSYLASASEQKAEPLRSDMYMLGNAAFRSGDYEAAVKAYKQVKQEKDTLSEATCLAMGNAYVKLNQPEQAKLSYQAAAGFGLTPAVTEEASYNYTLCTYQSSSALGESVRAFNDFLHRFPDSKYEGSIYRLLSDALMQSKNYAAAIATLDSIPNPSPKMRETKQYLRYQLGADNFLQGKMQQSAEWMTEVISHAGESDKYTTEAYYVRAEAYYRLRSYMACEKDLTYFFARPDARKSANYGIARYLQGYCAFSQNEYGKARDAFSAYIDAADATDPTYADALNRIGDCYFNARQFQSAITYYTQVSRLQAAGADYALFQRGYALGLQRKYAEKISVLRELVKRYPKSDYADDGVYETARAQLEQNDERGAIVTYEQLLNAYPHSSLARKASLERAMLYRNLGNNDQAIAAYRRTIEKYPATEEAYTALEALQALYVEQGNVNEYLAYTKSLAKMNMTVSTQEDSLLYAAAEMQYMQASYQKAAVSLNNYITQYCAGGRYCTSARYYLADSYYRLGKTSDALGHYIILAETAANPYQEEAATRVAEICYDKGDYTCALDGFYKMHALASSRENATVARLGILRCNQALARHQATIDIAEQILSDTPLSDDTRKEALYERAKAYIALGQWEKAQPDLQLLSAEVRTAQGAEAKYLLAESFYAAKDLDAAEVEIMEFTKMNTQQQYWLARALILLSDINRDRGEYFQARQYLLVLQQNYTAKDDIQTLIGKRLAALDELEKPVRKEDNNEED